MCPSERPQGVEENVLLSDRIESKKKNRDKLSLKLYPELKLLASFNSIILW